MESFKSMGAKMRFRAAIASGKDDVAEDAAAMMLQSAWRSKLAKRRLDDNFFKLRLSEWKCGRLKRSVCEKRRVPDGYSLRIEVVLQEDE